jgi:hypothetical protein
MQPLHNQRSLMQRVRPAKFVHIVYRTRCYEQMLAW